MMSKLKKCFLLTKTLFRYGIMYIGAFMYAVVHTNNVLLTMVFEMMEIINNTMYILYLVPF